MSNRDKHSCTRKFALLTCCCRTKSHSGDAMLMALMVAYIFLQILDVLPFIGSGLAMGSGTVGDSGNALGVGKLAPPGSNFMKNLNQKVS